MPAAVLAGAASALTSIKNAYDLAKGLQSLHTTTEVKQAVSDVLDQLITARTDALNTAERETSLLQKISHLEAEIDRLKTWDGERQRYELKRFNPGTLAYVLKPAMADGEPPHRLCAHCYQQRKKSILQATHRVEMRFRISHCPACNTDTPFGEEMVGPEAIALGNEVPPPHGDHDPYDRYRELDR